MLTDKVELEATVGIWPEPPFSSIKPSAIFVASGQIPEWNGDSLAIDPFPIFGICGISYGTQPILTIGITLQNDDKINELSNAFVNTYNHITVDITQWCSLMHHITI